MQYTLLMDSLTSVSSRTVCGWRADLQVDGNIDCVKLVWACEVCAREVQT